MIHEFFHVSACNRARRERRARQDFLATIAAIKGAEGGAGWASRYVVGFSLGGASSLV
jgi:hypothetical protein